TAQRFFGGACTANDGAFRERVAVLRGDELFARDGDGLLRLDDLDVAGDARREAVARLRELLGGQIARLARAGQLLRRGVDVEEGRANLVIDRRPEILGLRAALSKVRVGLEQPSTRAAALEDRDVDRTHHAEGAPRFARRESDVAVVGVHAQGGERLAEYGPARALHGK